jgi:hypothetical protein
MIKIYEGVKGSGKNLYEAICNSGYSCYNPQIMEDWVDGIIQEYLHEDWDNERIRQVMDKELSNSELDLFFDILVEHDINIDDPFLKNINRNDLLKWITEYKDENKIQLCQKIFKKQVELLEDDKYNQRIYERAWDDFNCFIGDIDKDDDQQVREFFGKEFKLTGYEIDGEEHNLDELFICPHCQEPELKSQQLLAFQAVEGREDDEDELFDSTFFYCANCGNIELFNSVGFKKYNPHISEIELVARGI